MGTRGHATLKDRSVSQMTPSVYVFRWEPRTCGALVDPLHLEGAGAGAVVRADGGNALEPGRAGDGHASNLAPDGDGAYRTPTTVKELGGNVDTACVANWRMS
jgi:hypothetical protein